MKPRFKPEQLDSFRAVSSPAAFARRNQTGDISPQSKLPDPATPEKGSRRLALAGEHQCRKKTI
jgi:hypothetical protein